MKEKKNVAGLPGNTLDMKLYTYYEEFQQVAKSFVNNIVPNSKIDKKTLSKKSSVMKLKPIQKKAKKES